MGQRRKSRFRLVPPEYEHAPMDKADLADQIAAQRLRLVHGASGGRERSPERKSSFEVAGVVSQNRPRGFPRSYIMRLLMHQPKQTLLVGAGVVFVLPWLLKKVGSKRLIQSLNVVSPLLMAYLNSRESGDDTDERSEIVKKG